MIISGRDIIEILYNAGICSVELLKDWLSTNFLIFGGDKNGVGI